MTDADERFLRELRATFAIEAREHLQTLADGLVALEKAPAEGQQALIEEVFRAAHSLKGAARSVDLREVEAQCHELESLLSLWKRIQRVPSKRSMDEAHRALDGLAATLPGSGTGAAVPAAAAETVRVPVARLDARLASAEEMVALKQSTASRAEELHQLGSWFDGWRRQWSGAESHAARLRHALRGAQSGGWRSADLDGLVSFLEWNADQVRRLEASLATLASGARRDRHALSQLADDLLEESKRMLLMPFSSVTAAFPKLVRDLCREQDKEADLVIEGAEVEIDRRVLEELKDPLIHLLRNSIDHGIEQRPAREAAGKPPRAMLRLEVSRLDAGKVSVRLTDDGRGIDAAAVRDAAVRGGLLSARQADALDDVEAEDLVFRTGLSTRRTVTPLSGHGLGLAIVREKAEKLGGTATVRSRPGRGTAMHIVVPSTLATFRGVVVEAGGALFVVPSAQVERVTRVRRADMRTVEGRDTVPLDGKTVALASLAQVLALHSAATAQGAYLQLMVLGVGDQRIAFVVDAVVDEQEVLVKPFAPPLRRVRNLTGATVLGSGQVAPILNVTDLLKSARRAAGAAIATDAAVAGARAERAHSILVAEDSITSRLLIKGILESSGYQVKTAADGMEAFALLRSHRFDVLVSDIDMPRLNGIALTTRIRADARLASLPVILVSTLDSREDRERGVDAGANAYIVKSRFDQSDLLDAVRRLT